VTNLAPTRTLRILASAAGLALLASLAPAAFGQAAQPPAPPAAKAAAPAAGGPKIVVPEEKKDVGTVAKGETIKHAFVVKNTGTSDLHITDVKPACGCTVSEFDKVVKPGGEGKITAIVDTKNLQGSISKTMLVVTDDPTTPQLTLYLMAFVKPFVEALPYGFFRIQALTGESIPSELVLVSDEPDFKPSKAEVQQSFLKVSLVPVPEKERLANKNQNQYKVTLTNTPDAPEGLLGGYVKVTTGLKKQPEMEIAISGYIKPTLSITPLSVNFGNFDPKGEAVRRNVVLINNNIAKENFTVTKAETNVPGISAEIVPEDKTRVRVVLSVDEKIKKGIFEGELKVKTNDAARAEVKVPIRGVVL
jgi:hypothetical protein